MLLRGIMPTEILGLDIGGANIKAATPTGQAYSRPFALWKQPDKLPEILAEILARFPQARTLAVTMTGEFCDCYPSKSEGVQAILQGLQQVASGKPISVWSTAGEFLSVEAAKEQALAVASANWHALATLAARRFPAPAAVLVDVGSTTMDIIPLRDGRPVPRGLTDYHRLMTGELLYRGVRRTPVFVLKPQSLAAEWFATTEDVYLILGRFPEEPDITDTADQRPRTIEHARARLARALGGDRATLPNMVLDALAGELNDRMVGGIELALREVTRRVFYKTPVEKVILSGAGEFLVPDALPRVETLSPQVEVVSLGAELGPEVSGAAPAYAVACLLAECPE